MIDLYAAGTSNGMRARIVLEECGLPYTFHPVDLMAGGNRTPEFLAMNPNGQIPVIVDSDGPGGKPISIFESGAILRRDGGDLEFAGFDGDLLRVRLKGACAGCPRSALDLKQVVETLVRRRYPAIREVRNVEPPPGGNP